MPVKLFKIEKYIVAGLLFAAFPAYAAASPQLGRVTIAGNCAQYFKNAAQMKHPAKNLKCRAVVSFKRALFGTNAGRHDILLVGQARSNSNTAPKLDIKSAQFVLRSTSSLRSHVSVAFKLAPRNARLIYLYAVVPNLVSNDLASNSCPILDRNAQSELAKIRACNSNDDCGLVLRGTGCGETQDLIANRESDPTRFYNLLDRINANKCLSSVPLVTICLIRIVDGFECVARQCKWKYVDGLN